MAPRVKTNPLNLETPISKENGSPTPFFVRQWQSLLELVASLIEIQQEIIELNEATIVAGTGLDGGGPISAGTVNLDLADTAVTPGSYTNADITVDAQGRITNAANGSGGASLEVQDDGVTEVVAAAVLNFTGAGVTVTDVGGGVANIDIPGGGIGSGWEIIASRNFGTTPGASFDVTDIVADDLLVIMFRVTSTNSSFKQLLVSTDNGTTYRNTSGDYVSVATTGVETAATDAILNGTAATAARTGTLYMPCSGVDGVPKPIYKIGENTFRTFVQSLDAINAIRIQHSAVGNMTGGTVYVLGRSGGGASSGDSFVDYVAKQDAGVLWDIGGGEFFDVRD